MSRKLQVHRRLVRKASAARSSTPEEDGATPREKAPAAEFMDGILETDRKTPRKQRHIPAHAVVGVSLRCQFLPHPGLCKLKGLRTRVGILRDAQNSSSLARGGEQSAIWAVGFDYRQPMLV